MLVQVWYVTVVPEFVVFGSLDDVVNALGAQHAATQSWLAKGNYNVTTPNAKHLEGMQPHKNRWDRVANQLIR